MATEVVYDLRSKKRVIGQTFLRNTVLYIHIYPLRTLLITALQHHTLGCTQPRSRYPEPHIFFNPLTLIHHHV